MNEGITVRRRGGRGKGKSWLGHIRKEDKKASRKNLGEERNTK